MHDDVSAIPSDGCNVISNSYTISNYKNNIRKDFIFNGSKWYPYRTQSSNYGNYDITGYSCIDINSLNSNAEFEPFLYFTSFCVASLVFFIVFKLIRGFLYVR